MAVKSQFTALTRPNRRLEAKARGMFKRIGLVMEEHADRVAVAAAKYPPPTPTYKRTFEYQRQWLANVPNSVHDTGKELVVEITNDAQETNTKRKKPYAKLVRGDNRGMGQAGVHRTRWTLLQTLLKRREYNVKIRQAVREALA